MLLFCEKYGIATQILHLPFKAYNSKCPSSVKIYFAFSEIKVSTFGQLQ